jgi:hypothetical protein
MIPNDKSGKKPTQLQYKGAFVGMSTSFEKAAVKKEESSTTPAESLGTPNYRPRADYLSRLGISKPGEINHQSR